MALIAKKSGSFVPAPEGLWDAVCVDVVDLGMVKQTWNGKEQSSHKCKIVWELSAAMQDGRPYIIQKRYTVSLHEKAQLYKDLKAWRGKPFTAAELEGFDVEKILGAPCQVVVSHDEKDGSVYANITAIMKAKPSVKLKPSGMYTRVKDRPAEGEDSGDNPDYSDQEQDPDFLDDQGNDLSGDDIPF